MTTQDTSIDQFLAATADGGPAIGLRVVTGRATATTLPGVRTRRVDGRDAHTLPTFYRAFAKAWAFPKHFGENKDAFDDVMTDLPDTTRGYLTEILHPRELLAADPDALAWFVGSIGFYAGEYAPHRQFGVLLLTRSDEADATMTAWRAAGADIVVVD